MELESACLIDKFYMHSCLEQKYSDQQMYLYYIMYNQ